MDEIEVKLSPLDEDSKQALMSFVNEMKAVRESMKSIKESFATELTQFRSTLDKISAGPQRGGGGQFPALDAAGFTIPGASQTRSGERSAQPSLPPNAPAATAGPYVDQGGHGGTGGGGGTGDPTAGYPYPMFPGGSGGGGGGPSAGASQAGQILSGGPNAPNMQHANWYGGDLQIPRINEFNIQDYTRMFGKVVGGPALNRYQQNQQARQQVYNEAIKNGQSPEDAISQAEQAAGILAPTKPGDTGRINMANAAARFGQVGPYVAATHNLMPQMLAGGYAQAGALTTRMSSGMGLADGTANFFEGTGAMLESVATGTFQGNRPGTGNEMAYRFAKAFSGGRDPRDPTQFGTFSAQDRGAFAEASGQVNMRGHEFDTAFDAYSSARRTTKPAGSMDPGQYVELFHEQTRNAGVDYGTAAKNLDDLAASAKYAGMNVKQMGDAAQAYHASNPQFTMAQSMEQVTQYARAGVNGDMANQIVNNPYVAGVAGYTMGITPEALAGAPAADVLRIAGQSYQDTYNSLKDVVTPLEPGKKGLEKAIQARITAQTGLSAETQKRLKYANEAAAASEVYENFDDPAALEKSLREMGLPNMAKDGKMAGLNERGVQYVMGGKTAEDRQKRYEKVTSNAYGYDVRGGGREELDKMIKERGKYDKDVQKFAEKMGLQDQLEQTQVVQVEFTGKAENWFQQVDGNSPKPDPTSPHRRGGNTSPSFLGGRTVRLGETLKNSASSADEAVRKATSDYYTEPLE